MKSDGDEKRRSDLYLIASSVADHQQVDWQSAEKSAPDDQLATIRGLRLVSRISLATPDGPDTEYALEEVRVLPQRPYEHKRWGPLLIEERIGSGSFGEVFRTRDPNLQRKVALKLYYLDRAKGEQQATDLLAEGRLLARVQHPNVATVYGAEIYAGRIGIWMEYIAGATLAEVIEGQGQLDAEEAMQIGRDVCRALAALHDAGIIHRDVKASNIMRAEDGRVVLMDLGVSRDIDDRDSEKLYGTPLFVAPEVLLAGTSTPQSDLYSVGVLLYLMVCGKYPVPGSSLAEIRESHQAGRVRNIRDVQPDLPEPFIDIVERALTPNPADRFATAGEFERALGKALDNGSETGGKPDRKPHASKSGKRLLWRVGVPVTLAVVLLAGYLILSPNLGRNGGAPSDIHRVLVTFLENRTDDESLDPIGPMTSDWITQGLAHAGVVNVVPTMTVLQAVSAEASAGAELTEMERFRVLAEASAATIILSGSYYLVSDSLHFHLNVTDTQREELLFSITPVSGPRERPMETIAQVRGQVTGALVAHLHGTHDVDLMDRPDLLHKPPEYEAYRHYFAGIENFGVNYSKSLYHFERATELDSTFVLPSLWVVGIYTNRGLPAKVDSILQHLNSRRDLLAPFERHLLGYQNASLKGDYHDALQMLNMAEKYCPKDFTINYLIGLNELGVNNPRGTVEAYAKIDPPDWYLSSFGGNLRFWSLARAHHHLGNYEQELATVNRALQYHPDDLGFRGDKVRALAALGHIQEIRTVIDECWSMPNKYGNPGRILCSAAKELRVQNRFDVAHEFANRAVTWYQEQSNPAEWDYYPDALRLAEQWNEAQNLLEKLAAENPDDIAYLGKLGTVAVRLGEEALAREIRDTLEHLDRPYLKGEHTYWSACISALLNEREQAVTLLRESFAQGLVNPDIKWREMDLEPLRDSPPFQELIKPQG